MAPTYRIRLPLSVFAGFCAAVPGLVVPPAFRPVEPAPSLAGCAAGLAARGLLLRAGTRAVLCPQLVGLLRVFGDASAHVELRVVEHDGAGGVRRWLSDVAVRGTRGVRLTRARARLGQGGERSRERDGERDGDVVEVAGFAAVAVVPQVVGCVPGSSRASRRVLRTSPSDLASALGAGGFRRSLWLSARVGSTTSVDTWWDGGGGWNRVGAERDGSLRLTPVTGAVLAADLAGLLMDGSQ